MPPPDLLLCSRIKQTDTLLRAGDAQFRVGKPQNSRHRDRFFPWLVCGGDVARKLDQLAPRAPTVHDQRLPNRSSRDTGSHQIGVRDWGVLAPGGVRVFSGTYVEDVVNHGEYEFLQGCQFVVILRLGEIEDWKLCQLTLLQAGFSSGWPGIT